MIFKISLFLHIIAAIFWIGGMLFLTLVVVPFLKTMEPEKRSEVYQVVGKRYRFFGWIAIVMLLITGPINLYSLGITPAILTDGSFYATPYGSIVCLKILFVLLIVITSFIHDFWLGPKARQSGKYSKMAMIFGRSNLIIALIIVIIAVFLRAGG